MDKMIMEEPAEDNDGNGEFHMTEKQFEQAGARYYYTISEKGAAITGYEGNKIELVVPESIEGLPVTVVEKKAFFNVPGLYRIYLSKTLESIGDWAFAHCRDLEEIYLSRKKYELGKSLFMECPALKRICLTREESGDSRKEEACRGFGSLLASTCGVLDAPYLFQTEKVDDEEWLALWDARMLTILHGDDMEGYTKLLLCGEEDYGSRENDLDFFLEQKRRRKVRVAFLRLLYDKGLAEDNRGELVSYLLSHTKGCESEETWLVLKEEHGEDMEYISLFANLGCLTTDNFDAILLDLGEEHPQMKAFLMKYREEHLKNSDFFEKLSLDL